MDLLSSHWITILTAVIAIAAFLYSRFSRNPATLKLCSAWFFAEIACDGLTTGFGEYADASQMVAYRYLYSITAMLFMIYVIKNKQLFSKSVSNILLLITVFSVLSGCYHWSIQSNWFEFGKVFYSVYSYLVESVYFLIITALEALMLLLGVYSAMDFANNPSKCERFKR